MSERLNSASKNRMLTLKANHALKMINLLEKRIMYVPHERELI